MVIVDHCGRHHMDTRVAVNVVVPGGKDLAKTAAILDAAEAIGELGAVLHGLELALGIGIVVGGVRAAVRLGDAEIGEQKGHVLGAHGRATIGMQAELIRGDALVCGRSPQ